MIDDYSAPATQQTTTSNHSAHVAGHIVPVRVLLTVCLVLLVLTLTTVAATWVDLDGLNLWIALAIATLKASLVALYFMHLRYDSPFNAFVLITALVFVMIFVGLALMDTLEYQPTIEWQEASALQRR